MAEIVDSECHHQSWNAAQKSHDSMASLLYNDMKLPCVYLYFIGWWQMLRGTTWRSTVGRMIGAFQGMLWQWHVVIYILKKSSYAV